jgi:hypothetical protein
VNAWGHEQVSIVIRESVQDNHGMIATPDKKIGPIVIAGQPFAQEASACVRRAFRGIAEILSPPRGPDSIEHRTTSSADRDVVTHAEGK